MSVLYNEIAPYPAQWLRNLISAGHIAAGIVDERSITELRSADVAGPGQRHFFAGIGVWSHALRLAGWPDDRDIWTGSCPCQPFSAAGRGRGIEDERHLWPEWFRLIRECRPGVIVGEQVASPAGLGWLDVVSTDLEGSGYAVGAVDLCAASVGAPHIRQRLFFVAIADVQQGDVHAAERQQGRGMPDARWSSSISALADLRGPRLEVIGEQQARRQRSPAQRGGEARKLADTNEPYSHDEREPRGGRFMQPQKDPAAGCWSDVEWLQCRDGKTRPTQPGLQPLAHGIAARMGRLRATGNAIVAPLAAEFIRAVMEL